MPKIGTFPCEAEFFRPGEEIGYRDDIARTDSPYARARLRAQTHTDPSPDPGRNKIIEDRHRVQNIYALK